MGIVNICVALYANLLIALEYTPMIYTKNHQFTINVITYMRYF